MAKKPLRHRIILAHYPLAVAFGGIADHARTCHLLSRLQIILNNRLAANEGGLDFEPFLWGDPILACFRPQWPVLKIAVA